MLPELDWDEEETQVQDRSAVCARPAAPAGPRQTESGVVFAADLRSTVVMPPEEEGVAEAPPAFDPRGTVRMEDEQRARRLRRTTVRATREQLFGGDAPSWDDDEPEVHAKRRFQAIAAKVVARGEESRSDEPGEADFEASGERRRRVDLSAVLVDDASPDLAPPPALRLSIPAAKKTMIGMPVAKPAALPPPVAVPAPLLVAPPVEIGDHRLEARRRARIAAAVTVVVGVASAIAAALLTLL